MKQLLCLLACLSLFFSCSQSKKKGGAKTYKVSTDITEKLSGEVIFAGHNTHNYYDIAITDDYYAFMDYYSDTLLQVRDKKDFSLYQIEKREREHFIISHPSFTKYDYINKDKKNAITIWDNDSHTLKRIDLNQTQASPCVSVESSSLLEYDPGNGSANCCLTQSKLYAVSFNSSKAQVFYSNGATRQYAIPPYPGITVSMPDDVRRKAYASDLVINEEKGVIVAALRFVDCVNFYNLNCEMTSSASFADYYTIPISDITNKYMDAERSKKCFIDICSSEEYVFCLFDGSTDFTNNSVIYVFDWEGKHEATLQAERSLRKIATEKSGEYLVALSPNEQGGRDVVKYDLKGKL